MAYLLGADEAGYGPNLGPLVISVTLWRVPDNEGEADLYELLGSAVGRCLSDAAAQASVAIADSKQLYKPPGGLDGLERGLFAALAACGAHPRTWRAVWECMHHPWPASFDRSPWFAGYDCPAPIDVALDEIAAAAACLAAALESAGAKCLAIRSAAVFPEEFNELTARYGSKGELLSQVTLGLVRDCLAMTDGEHAFINCDKHGGRNHYAGLLQHLFPDELIQVRKESTAESIYRWGSHRRRVQIRFTAKGESWLPSALASMASKYLRELAMRPFNEFWRRHTPDLKATAGYPLDARRFKDDIRDAQKKLKIPDAMLWRER
jgi:hypothetical protein